jgi:hypothetical protein
MKQRYPKRILSLDVHPLSFGFVIFDGPDRLLDWGIRSFRHGVNEVKMPMKAKLTSLIEEYRPSMMLAKPASTGTSRRMKMLGKIAAAYDVPVRIGSAHSIKSTFPQSNNKDQLASAVVERVPALSSYLPPRRKPWKAEHYRMSVFEAAALGLSYFARRHNRKQE